MLHPPLLSAEAIVGNGLTQNHYALNVGVHAKVTIGEGGRIYYLGTIVGELPLDSDKRVVICDWVTIWVNSIILSRPDKCLKIADDASSAQEL